jgi:uncharacterized caspase-like protein
MRPPFVGRLPPAALLSLAALLPLLPTQAKDLEGHRYALVVGVKTYKNVHLRPLRSSENDAADLAAEFRAAGYKQVVLLTRQAGSKDASLVPTAKNIRARLKDLLKDRAKTDTVVLAFSGHGVQFKGGKGAYLCPLDADLGDGKRDTLISLAEVYAELKKSNAGAKLLLLDACRNDPLKSAGAVAKKIGSKPSPQTVAAPGGVAALFSCSAGQVSYESDKHRHGLFFHHVLEGLRGKALNENGVVDLETLVAHVARAVPEAAKAEIGRQAEQKPTLRGKAAGLVLVRGARAIWPTAYPPVGKSTKWTVKAKGDFFGEMHHSFTEKVLAVGPDGPTKLQYTCTRAT